MLLYCNFGVKQINDKYIPALADPYWFGSEGGRSCSSMLLYGTDRTSRVFKPFLLILASVPPFLESRLTVLPFSCPRSKD